MAMHRHEHIHDHAAVRGPARTPADRGRPHDHLHSHEGQSRKVLAWAFGLTLTFMAVELVGGLLAGSLALLADAGHMLTDAGALALAWAASRIASRPADARRSFGYQRTRVLATFVNGCALLIIVAWIAYEALQRLFVPRPVDALTVIWIGSLGFAVNLIVFALLRRGHEHDMNVAAATLHVIGDLLGSVAAIVAAIIIFFTGWTAADPLTSLIVCALIVRSAWTLVRRSTHILMEGAPEGLDVDELRRTLEQRIPAIRDVHHVHLWLVGPHEPLMTMHATVVAGAHHATVLRDTKAVLQEQYGITHATIQIEEGECADEHCR
ncbi:MAG TPA: cation diffusion facilitator family transporter [Steroidobacteraceae bacterium]